MANINHIVARLHSQIARAEVVLFTGAGFSLEANDISGRPAPSTRDLTSEFWKMAFPSEPFDERTKLGDVFYAAKSRNPKELSRLVKERLSIDSDTLPPFYGNWFSIPWLRCYTLNIDDLELAVSRQYNVERSIYAVSATTGQMQGVHRTSDLQVIHLNGAVWDEVGNLTFSAVDYASRLTAPDQWLTKCSSDIITRPVVFVGTEVDESSLWQYLEFRKGKGTRGLRELRPGSILVSPSLNSARRLMLRELHIDWVEMTARQFSEEVLSKLQPAIEQGRSALRSIQNAEERALVPKLVSELSSVNPRRKTEYLMGEDPDWADLQLGRAIKRTCDDDILRVARGVLNSEEPGKPMVVTGTAGSGKSTSLMRLGLELTAGGVPTYWIDERSNFKVHRLRELVLDTEGPLAILIDDADLFGRTASGWVRELPKIRPNILLGVAVRSSKVEAMFGREILAGIEPYEISMPHLTDSDIDGLIQVLDEGNRLGILKGLSHKGRVKAFQREAGRQLLVAMIQATSGVRFTYKAVQEFSELPGVQRLLYAILCFVNSQRYTLTLDELLTAANDRNNETLNSLEALVARNIIVRDNRYSGYRPRHRVLAEQVVNAQEFRSQIKEILFGTYFALGSHLNPKEAKTNRIWRRWIWFIRHEFLLHFASPEDGREVYESIEGLLEWNHHYWLHRGSLEVEEGDLQLATNFLSQARSLAPGDGYVETEWAYLLMKKAAQYPNNTSASDWFSEGYGSLRAQIEDRGAIDPYPYHVLGSQTIAWTRATTIPLLEKRNLLRETLALVKEGESKHRRSTELVTLSKDVEREWLMTAVLNQD